MPENLEPKKVQITYVKSAIGYSKKHKKTIKALGFHHLNETVVHDYTSSIRGMLQMVNHLVEIVELVD